MHTLTWWRSAVVYSVLAMAGQRLVAASDASYKFTQIAEFADPQSFTLPALAQFTLGENGRVAYHAVDSWRNFTMSDALSGRVLVSDGSKASKVMDWQFPHAYDPHSSGNAHADKWPLAIRGDAVYFANETQVSVISSLGTVYWLPTWQVHTLLNGQHKQVTLDRTSESVLGFGPDGERVWWWFHIGPQVSVFSRGGEDLLSFECGELSARFDFNAAGSMAYVVFDNTCGLGTETWRDFYLDGISLPQPPVPFDTIYRLELTSANEIFVVGSVPAGALDVHRLKDDQWETLGYSLSPAYPAWTITDSGFIAYVGWPGARPPGDDHPGIYVQASPALGEERRKVIAIGDTLSFAPDETIVEFVQFNHQFSPGGNQSAGVKIMEANSLGQLAFAAVLQKTSGERRKVLVRATPAPPVRLRALEVVQSIQDLSNNVPLVSFKKTYVRAYLEAENTDDVFLDVHAQLRRRRLDGKPLFGPEFVEQSPAPWNANNSPHRLWSKDSTAHGRGRLDATMNFDVPEQWRDGDVEFWLEPLNFALIPDEPKEPDFGSEVGVAGDGKVKARFLEQSVLPLYVLPMQIIPKSGPVRPAPNREANYQAVMEASRRFPVAPINFQWLSTVTVKASADLAERYPTNFFVPDSSGLLKFVADFRGALVTNNTLGPNALVMATISDHTFLNDSNVAGIAWIGKTVGWSTVRPGDEWILSHELGHMLGRAHSSDDPARSGLPILNGRTQGYCDEQGPVPGGEMFPFFYRVSTRNRDGDFGPMRRPFLSPEVQSGFADLDSDFYQKGFWGFEPIKHGAIDPANNFELMSYCPCPVPWPSVFTYTQTLAFVQHFYDRPPQAFSARPYAKAANPGYLVVSGFVELNTSQVAWSPVRCFPEGTAADSPAGDWELRALDVGGTILSGTFFEALRPEDSKSMVTHFRVELPNDPSIRRFEVWRNGVQRSVIEASAHPPTVQVVWPNGGEILNGQTPEIRWRSSDADGDSLRYTVQYSIDGGNSWTTLGMALTGTNLTVECADLRATTNALVRVLASDGFDCVNDVSDAPFTIPEHAPEVLFLNLGPERHLYANRSEMFECVVFDREDGVIEGTNVVWELDDTGAAGAGNELLLGNLYPEAHRLIVSVTDSAGNVTRITNAVSVEAFPPAELQILRHTNQGVLKLQASGSGPSQLVIETSSNLVDWTVWTVRAQMNSTELLYSTNTPDTTARFFRARSEFLPTRFLAQPESAAVLTGADIIFNTVVSGQYLRYQWFFNGGALAGATNFDLSLTNVQGNQAGNYYLVASNPGFSTTSFVARVSVRSAAFEVVHHFGEGNDGRNAQGHLALGTNGMIYGCTSSGGSDSSGVLFQFEPATTNYSVLHEFFRATAGSSPLGGVIVASDGQLYGTARNNGAFSRGTLWRADADGLNFAVLRHFAAATDARNSEAALLEGSDGALYGTASRGGSLNHGCIFKVNKDGSDYAVLTDFNWNVSDAPWKPTVALVESPNGWLIGASQIGGSVNAGCVFSTSKDGVTNTVLGSLGTNSLPAYPEGALFLASDGWLYGTGDDGLFAISTNGVLNPILSFGAPGQGSQPGASVIEHTDGALLGTTREGGNFGFGTVFAVGKDGSDSVTLQHFDGMNGSGPQSPLLRGTDGWYYGTTYRGGAYNLGVLYRVQIQ